MHYPSSLTILNKTILPFSLKKPWKREENPKKCVTLWVVDCIDKLKLALRQPFAQQKQLSTPRIQRLGSRAHNKEKEKNDET